MMVPTLLRGTLKYMNIVFWHYMSSSYKGNIVWKYFEIWLKVDIVWKYFEIWILYYFIAISILYDLASCPIAYTLYIIGQRNNTFNVCLQAANISLTEYEPSEKKVLKLQSKFVSLFRNSIILFQRVVLWLEFGAGVYCWWELRTKRVREGSLQFLPSGIQLTLYERHFWYPSTRSQGKRGKSFLKVLWFVSVHFTRSSFCFTASWNSPYVVGEGAHIYVLCLCFLLA